LISKVNLLSDVNSPDEYDALETLLDPRNWFLLRTNRLHHMRMEDYSVREHAMFMCPGLLAHFDINHISGYHSLYQFV